MKQFINDTLFEFDKTQNRRAYSMRRITLAAAIPITFLLGIYIVLCDKYLDTKTVNIYAIQVFNSLLLFISVGLGLNLASYIKNKENE